MAMIVAAIRCVLEPLRLSWLHMQVTTQALNGYLYGALLAMAASLLMTIITYYRRYRLNIPVSVLALVGLLIIKTTYAL